MYLKMTKKKQVLYSFRQLHEHVSLLYCRSFRNSLGYIYSRNMIQRSGRRTLLSVLCVLHSQWTYQMKHDSDYQLSGFSYLLLMSSLAVNSSISKSSLVCYKKIAYHTSRIKKKLITHLYVFWREIIFQYYCTFAFNRFWYLKVVPPRYKHRNSTLFSPIQSLKSKILN